MKAINGYFGEYGGRFIPETLMNAVLELESAYETYKNDKEFSTTLDGLLKEYVGRPSLLYFAQAMSKDLGGAKIYLKREDLNHTGSHKINNVLGQILLILCIYFCVVFFVVLFFASFFYTCFAGF